MKTKKLVTILLVLGSFMAVAGTSSANVISFSGNVSFDHDQVVEVQNVYDCPQSLTYTFLSDTVSLSQFNPSLGILNSVELIVESDIDVETYYYYYWDHAYASQWWYSNVIGSVNGLQATFSQSHNNHTIGQGYHDHVFTIDGTASESASSGLAGFIGTGMVDVEITGDDKLCAWWNPYRHIDTDTYGTVTATLIYNYTLRNVISFSGNVSFDHDQVVEVQNVYDCPQSLTYTFLSDTVSLSQFNPSLGILNSVELIVESDIDVETYYYYYWDHAYASQWWYSNVIGSVNGLQATFSQSHNNHTIGQGYHDHVFTIDGTASESASSGLAGFIGTGMVDVEITGDDKLCAWWNPYRHIDTDTYGTVTATLIYNYTPLFDFFAGPEGWSSGGAPIVYTLPDCLWEADYLKMTSSTNTNTFGYWVSPQDTVPADADYLYRARFTVSTDITDQAVVPQIRFRANSLNLQQYDVLSIESAGQGESSPAVAGTDYDLYFVPPSNETAVMLAFDLLNFNPNDAAVAELSLDTVSLERFALSSFPTPTVVHDYTFDVSTEGWTSGGAPTVFTPPGYIWVPGTLELRTTTNTNTFGYWGSDPVDITIEADRLYRVILEVRTDVTSTAQVPEMRLRFNTGNLQASHTFGIASIGDGANSPGTTNTTYDRVYFLPPPNCVGEDLIVSFDILSFDPDDASAASLILDRAIIESLSPPALP